MWADYVGTTGNDTYAGTSGVDSIVGDAGNDTLGGGSGSDVIRGDDGNDSLNGGDQNDVLVDDIAGQPYGNDTLYGNLGNDTLYSYGGSDILDGYVDTDMVVYDRSTVSTAMLIDARGMTSTIGVTLSDGTIIRRVDYGAFTTGSGDDTFYGHIGRDTFSGGGGADIAYGGNDFNLLQGDDGNDTLTGGKGNDTLEGGDGDDSLDGADDTDRLYGYGGNDTLTGGADNDFLYGGVGDDNLSGGIGFNRLFGEDGNDIIEGGSGGDELDGGAGIDTASYLHAGGNVAVSLAVSGYQNVGSEGSDSLTAFENLTGGFGYDTLTGDGGNNVLDGSGGVDSLIGGLGNDTYYVDNSADKIVEFSGEGTDTAYVNVTYSISGRQVENLILTGSEDLGATGNSLANSLTGNSGDNLLNGDTGVDTVTGGLGNDTYVVNVAGDVVIEAAGEGDDLVQASVSYGLSVEVERLELIGTGNVNGTGNALNNVLTGNAGNNVLDGASGVDTMIGGLGNDSYYVDDLGDVVTEAAGQGTDLIYAGMSYSLAGKLVENLILTGTANLSATGNTLGNALTGNAGNNALNGGAAKDTMAGGLGDDSYWVDNTGDKVVENNGEGFDTIYASVTYNLTGRYAEVLELTGAANIDAAGNSLGNTLRGNSGSNTLNGLGGNDILTGNGGLDTFLFQTGSRSDTITDFTVADGDLINVNAYTGGVANSGLVSQAGLNVVINLGGGNLITVLNAAQADVLSHIVW
ncbi:hypothetical protein ABAC460_14535 [Asticcacaulis sp. AC460]|nr:hypothetical protein ABAC460_14535 [Asticcacaulis sp. AC460]